MEFLAVCIMFMCLCADNMVMANMSGMKPHNNDVRSRFSMRIALSFSLFHILFLIIGYVIALLFSLPRMASVWITFAFLTLIGIRLLLETVEKSPSFSVADADVNAKLIKTSVLLALNTFMIGFALEIMKITYSLFWPILALFVISMIFSLGGFLAGKPDSKKISTKFVESAAGIIMIVLAIRILIIYH